MHVLQASKPKRLIHNNQYIPHNCSLSYLINIHDQIIRRFITASLRTSYAFGTANDVLQLTTPVMLQPYIMVVKVIQHVWAGWGRDRRVVHLIYRTEKRRCLHTKIVKITTKYFCTEKREDVPRFVRTFTKSMTHHPHRSPPIEQRKRRTIIVSVTTEGRAIPMRDGEICQRLFR